MFSISKDQQKRFVDHFLDQVLSISLDLVERGKDFGSPGATIHAVGQGVIKEIMKMDEVQGGGDHD